MHPYKFPYPNQPLKFAIITPTYNHSGFLMQAIDSVQQSILKPNTNISLQHIIWDDASTDDTEERTKQKILQIQDNHNNNFQIKHYKATQNAGTSSSLNRAIETLTDPQDQDVWIMVLDHDDILLPRSVKNFADQIIANPEAQWFTTDFLQTDKDLKYLNQYYGWQFQTPNQMIQAILNGDHFCQQNVCYHKSLWNQVGGYDPLINVPLDIDLYIRFLLANQLPKYTGFINHLHRFHNQNASSGSTAQNHHQDLNYLYQKYLPKLQKLNIYPN